MIILVFLLYLKENKSKKEKFEERGRHCVYWISTRAKRVSCILYVRQENYCFKTYEIHRMRFSFSNIKESNSKHDVQRKDHMQSNPLYYICDDQIGAQ